MKPRNPIIIKSVKQTCFWATLNLLCGLAPFLLMIIAYFISDKNSIIEEELLRIINGGAILFASNALMIAVAVDAINGNYRFKKYSYFFILVAPFIVLGFLLLVYLLIVLKVAKGSLFSISSGFFYFILLFSIFYSILAKYNMFVKDNKKEEVANE